MPRGMVVFRKSHCFYLCSRMLAHFRAPKYPKRFVNPARWLLTAHAHQKNSSTLFNQFLFAFFWLIEPSGFVFDTPKSFESALMSTKPLRLRFGSTICSFLQLFFWFSCHLGLTAFLGKTYGLLKEASKTPKTIPKRCVQTMSFCRKNDAFFEIYLIKVRGMSSPNDEA